jgi:hypothetical protein
MFSVLVNTLRLLAILLGVSVLPCTSASGDTSENVFFYKEYKGADVKRIEWRLKKGDGYTLSCKSSGEHHITTVGSDYDTSRWQVFAHDNRTKFVAQRDQNTIVVRGLFKGKPLEKTIHIDHHPWYQATSLSLRKLIASVDSEKVFWTIRFDNLSVHKLKASKVDIEEMASRGEVRRFQRIRLNLTGLLKPFWKSDYWFSLPNGIFYRFEGPSGPPGSPLTTVIIDKG